MFKICFIITFLIITFFYFEGCGSTPYTISETDSPEIQDTSKLKNREHPEDTTTFHPPPRTLKQLNALYPKKNYVVRSAPGFTLQANIGFDYGLSAVNANYRSIYQTSEFEGGQNFGVRSGFGFLALGKIPLNDDGSFRAVVIGSFNYFSFNSMTSKVATDGLVRYNLYTLGGGVENSFTPSYRLKPYIGAAVLLDLLGGRTKYTNDSSKVIDVHFKPTFRVGVSVTSGMEYLLTSHVGLNFSINLTCANLLIKSSSTSDDPNNIPIRDKMVTSPIMFAGYKQFLFTSFFIGVNYYFGIKEMPFHI